MQRYVFHSGGGSSELELVINSPFSFLIPDCPKIEAHWGAHYMLHEPERETVIESMEEWLKEHM